MSTTAPSNHEPPPRWRRLPVGAEPGPDGGVHFRVWAPAHRRVAVTLEDQNGDAAHIAPLAPEGHGYFSALVPNASAGSLYRFRLDDDEAPYPDPASRFQPQGPHGPSQVIDPAAFAWRDALWRGVAREGQVVYELHVGTFTPEGSWAAATAQLDHLAALGVTILEVMPVAEFAGRFGWGYDGVDLFAPYHHYGTPDDMRRFVDRAHALGLGVILDVVYNHLGPDGNYLKAFTPAYFSEKHRTDWGEALNFDGPSSGPVRELFVANAEYWVREFHLDGLRMDATQNVYDESPCHILREIAERVRLAANGRGTFVVGENEPQDAQLVREPGRGGCGLDAVWNDDWHHTATVALTGRDEAYYTDYRGSAQEFVSAAKYGFLYQGQWYRWQSKRRGTPTFDLEPSRFVHFLQNHDQIANSGVGERVHHLTSPGRWRALTALLLLGPQTPMLFQGEEYAASQPFLYFADHQPELARLVARGRRTELSQFPNLALAELQARLPDPAAPATFERCKLHPTERERHPEALALHRDLLRLRREDPAFAHPRHGGVDGAVFGPSAFVLRFFVPGGRDRLLIVNLGGTLHLDPAPEPLLAPPAGARWTTAWTSDDPRYGGLGTPPLDAPEVDRAIPGKPGQQRAPENWRLPGEAAVVLIPESHEAENR